MLMVKEDSIAFLRDIFADRLQRNAPLDRFTAARVGGPADYLLELNNSDEIVAAIIALWEQAIPFVILGGGSNVLISDEGLRGVVLINKARSIKFDELSEPPSVWAESGANLGRIARQAAILGLGGLEWAGGIPGTLGGALVGNAGAHGSEMADNLISAQVLCKGDSGSGSKNKIETWNVEQFEYSYRCSVLKDESPNNQEKQGPYREQIVLSALLRLERSTPSAVGKKMDEFNAFRRRTQPPGASMGSMFKNPAGDYAGRLIESAGLKGTRIGGAQISPLHANFFVNLGNASASDIRALIKLAQRQVEQEFSIHLELEIELLGEHKD